MSWLDSSWPTRLTLAATGAIASAIGASVLIGWRLHSVLLIQLDPTIAPTQRMTAASFLVSGFALIAAAAGRRRVAAACSVLVLMQAILVSLEYALHARLGIDEWMGRDYIPVHVLYRGRMSLAGALCFAGSSLTILEMSREQPRRFSSAFAGVMASALLSVGMFGTLGYILARTETYGSEHFNLVGLYALGGFAVLGAGLMAWSLGTSGARQGAPDWLFLSIGTSLSVGALGAWRALMARDSGRLAMLSGIILAGGLLSALLVAVAVAQTQRARRRNRELHASGALLQQLFDNSPDGLVIVGGRGEILRVNSQANALFGYRPGELLGTVFEDLVPVGLQERHCFHPKSRGEAPRPMDHGWEPHGRRKDGSEFPVEIALAPLQSPANAPLSVALVRDITERRRAEEALRLSEERFRSAFERGPLGVTLVGTDYRMFEPNPELCRMLGYSQEELSRMTPLEITHPDDLAPSLNLMQHLFQGEVPVHKLEKRYVRKNGEIIWASLSVGVIKDREGRPLYAISMVEDITDRKQSERTLAKQAALLDLAHDAIFVSDLENRIAFWNRGAKDLYGWTAGQAVGHLAHELLHTRFPSSFEDIKSALRTRGEWEGELEHTTRDGRTIIVTSRWSLQLDDRGAPSAVLEINRDISSRKRADEQLRNLMERLSLATRTASIGIWDLDLRSQQGVWDDTSFEILGIPKVVPLSYEDFARRIHPADLDMVKASLQRAVRGKTQDFVEFRVIRPDGSVRHVSSAQGAVRDDHGDVVRLVGTAVDITERKQMEAQIEASKEQMLASARLSALGMMAGGVAHEINNPLWIIHASAADLLRLAKEGGAMPAEVAARNSERILHTANRITRIIKSMRHLAREGAHDRARTTPVSRILEEALEVCKERFKNHAVTLRLPDLHPALCVKCREVQISQVLLNLLQNSFDAVADQPGERWVRFDVAVQDHAVVFSVIDSGPGIPPELRTRIMEPFFTTKDVGKGTGLGLSLSRTIVQEHGSKLELTEEEGHPRFSFSLPLSPKEEPICS